MSPKQIQEMIDKSIIENLRIYAEANSHAATIQIYYKGNLISSKTVILK